MTFDEGTKDSRYPREGLSTGLLDQLNRGDFDSFNVGRKSKGGLTIEEEDKKLPVKHRFLLKFYVSRHKVAHKVFLV